MKVLLFGRDGQVGHELAGFLGKDVVALSRKECNVANPDEVVKAVRTARPDAIFNAAAYTAVDRAESEPDQAFAVNARAPGVLAEEARRVGAWLVHYSTDYVFDGAKGAPYTEDDPVNPLQVYGRSKLEGERAIRTAGADHLILRTSWVYAARGANFVLTMLKRARDGAALRVVDDQWGTPTWARDIAALTAAVAGLRDRPAGTFHAAAGGATTWHEYAREIFRLAGLAPAVQAISSAQWPVRTPRPAYSVLDSARLARATGLAPIGDWRERLSAFDDLHVLRDLGRLA